MNHKRVKHLKGIAIILVVIIAVAIVALYVYKSGISSSPKQIPKGTSSTIESIQKETNKDAALKKLQKLADTTSNKSDKSAYLTAAVDISINYTDNYSDALSVSKDLEANEKTASSAAYLAIAYDLNKDYKNAATYYGIAAERSPKPTNANERSLYNDYMVLKSQEEAKIK